jgi:hypothetical protein
MRRATLLSLGLGVLALWALAVPLTLIIHSLGAMCKDYYVEHWGFVPGRYVVVTTIVTGRHFVGLCLITSAAMLVLELVLRSERARYTSQIVCLSFWLLTTAACVHLVTSPYLKDIGLPVQQEARTTMEPQPASPGDVATRAAPEK